VGEHVRRTTSETLFSLFQGWIALHNRTYRDEFVKGLGWKVVSCHKRSLAGGIFMGVLTLFQTHLPQFLPWWRCLCQGFLLWTLSSTLGCHNRNPWPGCFVPSPIFNILLVWTPCLMHRCVCIWQYILQNYNYKLHFQNLSIYLMFAGLVTCEIATYSWPLEKTGDGKYSISLAAAPGTLSLSLLFSPLSLCAYPAFFLVGYSQK
jgi:hypothetical protein